MRGIAFPSVASAGSKYWHRLCNRFAGSAGAKRISDYPVFAIDSYQRATRRLSDPQFLWQFGERNRHIRRYRSQRIMATPKVNTEGSPLSEADYKLINQALYKLSEAARQLDLAEQAGLDVGPLREIQQNLLVQARAVKETYFPGRA